MSPTCCAVRSQAGRFCRDKMRQVGPSRRSIATSQLTIVSTASQGRHTELFGISRSDETCSIGW